jgi:toxin FitB
VIIVDTNVISEMARQEPAPAVQRWLDAQPGSELFLTAITIAEIRFGVARLPDGRRKRDLSQSMDRLVEELFPRRVLPFDHDAGRLYGDLMAGRERTPLPLKPLDAMIAAIALSSGAALATRNIRDFEGLPLKLHNPFES